MIVIPEECYSETFLLEFATLKDYKNWEIIQEERRKGKIDYIRVTNTRGKKLTTPVPKDFSSYFKVISKYLKIG